MDRTMRLHANSKPALLGLVVILLSASMAFKCGGSGRSNDPYRNAVKAADDFAVAIQEMVVRKRKLAIGRKITLVQEKNLTDLLLKLNTSERAFVNEVKALRSDPSPATRASLLNLWNHVMTDLNNLRENGLGALVDQEAIDSLSQVVKTMTESAAIISQFLNR